MNEIRREREGKTKLVVVLLLLLFFVFSVFPVSAQSWASLNTDYDFNNPSEWMPATWGLAREGVDIFPEMTMTDGIATTTLNSYAGKNEWDSASYRQDKYQGSTSFQIAPTTSESTVSYKVKPFYENPGRHACFNIFVEIWLNFTEPTGVANGRIAELMFKQRVITSPDISSQPENSYTSSINPDAGWGDWYLVTYRLPDIPFNQWTQQELSWNQYFYPKLKEYDIDLTKGHIYALVFGIEGFSTSGGVGAQWDYVNCMAKSTPINQVPDITPTPTPTATPPPEPTGTPTPTLNPTPTLTPTIVVTSTPTSTSPPAPTPTSTPIATPIPTVTPVLTVTFTPTSIPTPILTATPKPTTTATPTPLQSHSPFISPTETATYQHNMQPKPQTINYAPISLPFVAAVASIVTVVVFVIKKKPTLLK